ncbi:hypothetical protein [Pseudanabaena sp. PCC 6802]|uniref:hypothetical protein n=1 Tax=Pseudanabaena sp. PCC 6802 TaxID=118173 RepID=UPI00034695DB|nr:hypothetical protein [Pseudanabaena sp. PCC 6802]
MNPLTPEIEHRVTALEAQAVVNDFLSNCLPDCFTANIAKWADDRWRVPVILTYPRIGSVGEVGEVQVDAEMAAILSHTPLELIKQKGIDLYKANQDAIEAAFL